MEVIIGLCVILSAATGCEVNSRLCFSPLSYPKAPRNESIVDNYYGVMIKDPYRWLEDPDLPETQNFIQKQNNISSPYLNSNPVKKMIKQRLVELWNYPKYSTPIKRGSKYFYFKNNGLQNQDVLYFENNLDGNEQLLFDPNKLSENGTVGISDTEFSNDGNTLAYGLSEFGSDWVTIKFKDVATGRDYPEGLELVKFTTMSWTNDSKGFFYTRYPNITDNNAYTAEVMHQKLYFHKLNTSQSEDILIFEYPQQPRWRIAATVSDDGRYLIVSLVQETFNNLLLYVDLSQQAISRKMEFRQLIFDFVAEYEYITNDDTMFILRTNQGAPNYQLVAVDLRHPEADYWTPLIKEHPTDVLYGAVAVDNNKLVIHYIRDVRSVLQLHSLKTGEFLQDFDLDVGTIEGISAKRSQSEMFYQFTSFLTPGVIYYVDFKDKEYKAVEFLRVQVIGFDPSLYESKQVFYKSKDGTEVPMFMASKKSLLRDGSNPVLLSGYGGFSISIQPAFNIMQVIFMQHFNGIIAVPNIRGGGEYGEKWHDAGRLLNKQNGLDDFQAAAEFLISQGYTRSSHLTALGETHGALVVAASINQRPDLFGAAILQAGVLDLLRYQRFTIGYSWIFDYGSSWNRTQFKYLIKYSPLHNIRTPKDSQHEYPAILVLTADHDDRVVPAHSLKYIATLQNAMQNSTQRRPLLARIDEIPDHDHAKPFALRIDEYSDMLTFVSQSLGFDFTR